MAKRKGITKVVRFNVFKRDAFTCQYCGRNPPNVVLEIDHVIPVADGGSDDLLNLLTSCFDCNRGKAANSLEIVPPARAEQIAAQMKAALEATEQLRQLEEYLYDKQVARDADCCELWNYFVDYMLSVGFPVESFSAERQKSIDTFLRKLPYDSIRDSIEVAVDKKKWSSFDDAFRYFCGVCWGKIRDLQA